MNSHNLEAQMREGERFHDLRVPDGHFAVIRVDGRGFSRFTERNFEKPFDSRFARAMNETGRALLESWGGIYLYAQSDEISLLLPREFAGFGRGVEKLVSLVAAQTSVNFSALCGHAATFDARIWTSESAQEVADYFVWRQRDATRNALSMWCYWTLRHENRSARAVTRRLDGLSSQEKKQILRERDIEFAELPMWQKRGVGMWWESFTKIGHDPKRGEVEAQRRRVRVEEELPDGEEYRPLLASLMQLT